MKLYYSAGACSTSCHITLEESGLKYEAIGIDWDNKSDSNIAVVTKMNPLGTLPIMLTDDGRQLDQNLAIHTYIADRVPEKSLLPAYGTPERAQAMNWLSYVAADLHKTIGALFSLSEFASNPNLQNAVRDYYVSNSKDQLKYLDAKLAGRDYLMGNNFCVADAYAFVVLGWTKWLEIPIVPHKNIQTFMSRVAARPAVAKVLKTEGLF